MTYSRCSFSAVSFCRHRRFFPIVLITVAVLLLGCSGVAQQTTSTPDVQQNSTSSPKAAPEGKKQQITIPAGTSLALILTHPIDSKSVHKGDLIYAQTTAPVTVDGQVALPAGTFVQGRVEKLSRKANRGELLMQSMSFVFPDGYVADAKGPVNVESEEGTAWRNPSSGAKAGAIAAPIAGFGLGLLIGNATDKKETTTVGSMTVNTSSHTGLAIGSAVGLMSGGIISLVLLGHSHDFYVEAGSAMQSTLTQPVTLALGFSKQAQPLVVVPSPRQPIVSTDHGICYTPDTPGTPPIVIPGTPPVGDSPGTPPTVIPGTPSTPGTSYPCP